MKLNLAPADAVVEGLFVAANAIVLPQLCSWYKIG
jgi:hypothetical protein